MRGVVMKKAITIAEDDRRKIVSVMNGELSVKDIHILFMKEGETDFVKLEHFKYALENTIVNVSDRKKQQEDYMKLVKKFVNDKRFITEAKLDFEKPKKSRASLAGEMVNE